MDPFREQRFHAEEPEERKYAIIRINILIKDLFSANPFMYTGFVSQREYIGVIDNRDTASKQSARKN